MIFILDKFLEVYSNTKKIEFTAEIELINILHILFAISYKCTT